MTHRESGQCPSSERGASFMLAALTPTTAALADARRAPRRRCAFFAAATPSLSRFFERGISRGISLVAGDDHRRDRNNERSKSLPASSHLRTRAPQDADRQRTQRCRAAREVLNGNTTHTAMPSRLTMFDKQAVSRSRPTLSSLGRVVTHERGST